MAGAEMFTVLAVLEARDMISEALDKADVSVSRFSESLQRMATVAEESGARTDEALLQTASGADALDLATARVEAAQAKMAAATREQAAAEEELLAVQREAAAGEMDAAEAANKQAAALDRLQAAEQKTAAASKELATAEKTQADTAAAAAAKTDEAAASTGRFSGAAAKSGAAMSMASKVAIGAGIAVAAIGYESVKAATSFQTLTTQLVTTAGEAPSALKQVQQGILAISNETATSANDLAKSMYIVEAAGYNAAHGGLDVLKASTEGARLENSDFKTVANGVTDILKDYHLSASQSANVTSQLVVAVGHGKANFQQFSSALSNILPLGAAVHLKFADLAGVLAEMTSHGVTAQRASQNMANALRSLEAPSGTMVKEFKQVGITSQDVQNHLSKDGLGGTLQWLSGIAKDNAARLGQTYPGALRALMGTAAGLNVALMTTGENSKDVNTAIAAIGKASADSKGNVQGFAQVQQTLGFKMDQAKQAIHNTGIAIGTMLLPFVTRLMGAINSVLVPLAEWAGKHQKLIGLIMASIGAMAAVAGAIKLVSVAMGILNAVMDANPIVLVIIAIAALAAGLVYAWNHFQTFRQVVTTVFDAVKTAALATWHGLQVAWKGIVEGAMAVWHGLQVAWNGVVTGVMAVWHAIESAWNAVESVTVTVWNAISGFFKKWWPLLLVIFLPVLAAILAIWNHFHTQIEDTAKTVWNGIKTFLGAVWNGIKVAAGAVWAAIKFAIVNPIYILGGDLISIWNMLKPYLIGAWNAIRSAAVSVWNAIKSAMITPIESAWHTITSTISRIASAISSGLHSAWNAVKDVGSWFMSIGSDIVNGIISGVENMGGALFSSLKNLASGALNAAKSFLGISSPSKLFRDEVGRWIAHGVARGVDDNTHVAVRSVRGMAASIAGVPFGTAGVGGAGLGVGGGLSYVSGSGTGGGTVIIDLRGSQVMSDADMKKLADKIGAQMPRALASAGVRVRG